ncbi:pentapeptide repeat-containing protein, partial [Bacillus mobilis]
TLTGRERVQARDATRQLILQAAGGAAALAALVFTARSYLLNRRGQQTQRFKDAGEHLGSENVVTRIAGIYSLEHVMRESPEDHATVVEVLCAFIREHAPPSHPDKQEETGPLIPPRTDIQAALTVVARRPDRPEDDLIIDLSGLHLEGARLPRARLDRANLHGSYLHGADLTGAHLTRANLSRTVLTAADLGNANLRESDLTSAALRDAGAHQVDLRSADLHRANFSGAHLEEARLDGANLLKAELTKTHLDQASLKDATLICADLRDAFVVNADLSRADLSSALVDGTMFHRSTMRGTSFRGADGIQLAHFDFVDASDVLGFTHKRWESVFTNSSTRAPKVFDHD